MTRDEAIKRFSEAVGFGQLAGFSENWIDGFVAIGILNLDEPKGAMVKFREGMESEGYQPASIAVLDVLRVLETANLKIVEK